MKPCDLSVQDVALFSRLIVERADYDSMSESEKQNCDMALTAAKAFAAGYSGLDINTTDLEDVTYAVLIIAAEMVDNHQMTMQYTGQNPTALQILNMHSTNLLPRVEDDDATYGRVQEMKRLTGESDIQILLTGCVDPDLKASALQQKFKGATPAETVKALLLPGEIEDLSIVIEKLSGYRRNTISEVKNG